MAKPTAWSGCHLVLPWAILGLLVVGAAAADRCEDNADFTDEIGISCSGWEGSDCTDPDLTILGYTTEGLSYLVGNCSASCGTCTPPPQMYIKETRLVKMGFSLNSVDLANSENTTEELWRAGFAAAFAVETDALTELVLTHTSVQTSCTFYVAGAPRTLLTAANKLATSGSSPNTLLRSALDGLGVDVGTMTVSVTLKAKATNGALTLHSSLDEATILGIYMVNDPPETDWCFDDATLADPTGEWCKDWVGYDCTDTTRWTADTWSDTYTETDLQLVQRWCPQSCGFCKPPAQKTDAELLASCEDDELKEDFCSRWRGLNCEWAEDLGYESFYQEVLLARCPMSCGKCTPAVTPTCEDNPDFKDENNRTCADWASYGVNCGYEQDGYTRHGVLQVQKECRAACGICGALEGEPSAHSGYYGNLTVNTGTAKFNTGAQYDGTCQDSSTYSYIKMYGCDDFIGKKCTPGSLFLEPRWTYSPTGYTVGPWGAWQWHKPLWTACPVACGLCEPEDRPTASDLMIECYDDPYTEDWCSLRFQGTDCSTWTNRMTVAFENEGIARMNDTLFSKCPATCGLCTAPVCGPGSYRDRSNHSCEDCDVGTYNSESRSGDEATKCTAAMAGDYVAVVGATSYSRCEAGEFSSTAGSTGCGTCPAGSYSDSFSATECVKCKVGWYQEEAGSTECIACPVGNYSDTEGATACEACPLDRTTFFVGARAITECGCPEGTYQPTGRTEENCETCPDGMTCPGGHYYGTATVDMTGVLADGMMSLPEDPWTVYTCFNEEKSCPGERSIISSYSDLGSVCKDGRSGVRCSKCPADHYRWGRQCEACGSVPALHFILKGVFVLGLQFAAFWLLYKRQGKTKKAAWMMITAFMAALQTLHLLSRIDLGWPSLLSSVFKVGDFFSVSGFFETMAIRDDCLWDFSPGWVLIRNALVPLVPFADVGVVALIYRQSFVKEHAFNCVGKIYSIFFISICGAAIDIFRVDRMPHPNEKMFVRGLPEIELYSGDWFALFPISVFMMLFYIFGYLFWTGRGIVLAPKKVSTDPGFAKLYDYVIGEVGPACWWWTMIVYLGVLGLCIIQTASTNVFTHVYISMLLVVAIIICQLSVRPAVYRSVDSVQTTLNIMCLVFLIFSTAFFKEEDLTEQDMDLHAGVMIFIIVTVLVYVFWSIFRWGSGQLRAPPIGKAAHVALRARDVMTALVEMPEAEFMGLASGMLESDCELMKDTTDMFVTVFLKEQPSGFFRQRLIHGMEYKVWEPSSTAESTMDKVSSKAAHSTYENNVKLQIKAQKLAHDLRKAKVGPLTIGHEVEAARGPEEVHEETGGNFFVRTKRNIGKRLAKTRVYAHFKHIGSIFLHSGLELRFTEDEFVERVRGRTALKEKSLREIYQLINLRDEDDILISEFFHILAALAPQRRAAGQDEDDFVETWGDEENEKHPEQGQPHMTSAPSAVMEGLETRRNDSVLVAEGPATPPPEPTVVPVSPDQQLDERI